MCAQRPDLPNVCQRQESPLPAGELDLVQHAVLRESRQALPARHEVAQPMPNWLVTEEDEGAGARLDQLGEDVAAAGVVGEAMVALVLAQAALDKFGGDSLSESMRNFHGYLAQLREY